MPAVGPAAEQESGSYPVASQVQDVMHQQVKHLCPVESPRPSSCLLPLQQCRGARSGLRAGGWEAAQNKVKTKGGDSRGGGTGRPSCSFWQTCWPGDRSPWHRESCTAEQSRAAATGLPGVPAPSSPQQAPVLCVFKIPADMSFPQGAPSSLTSEQGSKQLCWESKTEVPQMK